MAKRIKTKKTIQLNDEEDLDETRADLNDIACVDCGKKYPLVPGSSNCRCKRHNALYKYNKHIETRPSAK